MNDVKMSFSRVNEDIKSEQYPAASSWPVCFNPGKIKGMDNEFLVPSKNKKNKKIQKKRLLIHSANIY